MSTDDDYLDDQFDYIDCWNCGDEGYSHHDCGEDCCCCLWPEDNVVCDICNGKGGWKREVESVSLEKKKEKASES